MFEDIYKSSARNYRVSDLMIAITISTRTPQTLAPVSPQHLPTHSFAKQIGKKKASKITVGSLSRKRWATEISHDVSK